MQNRQKIKWAAQSMNQAKAVGHVAHLNGLRAFAFIGVVLFHFKHGCKGGFLGVDVFFVLSGYLMTRSISAQLASNTFSYPRFLARRFWRLYPALLCAILGALALTFCFFSSDLAVDVARSAIASILGVSNLLFLSEQGYFGRASVVKPLLHTWSLSVEWQFYLVWPIMMATASRFGSRLARPHWPLVALCIVSFWYGTRLSSTNPSAAFFGLPGRAFEFGLGALAATSAPTVSSRVLGNGMSVVGSTMILLSFLYLRPSHGAPAVIALPALFGALLVMLSPSNALCNRVYTLSVADYLGKISYSAYLVHWPVYVFYHNVFQYSEAPWQVEATIVACMMFVSSLMYHHVEDKYRNVKQRRHAIVGLSLLAGALAVSLSCYKSGGWTWRYSTRLPQDSLAFKYMGFKDELESIYKPRSQPLFAGDKSAKVAIGYIPVNTSKMVSKGSMFDALVIGDSFAPAMAPALHRIATENSQEFAISRTFGCPPFLDSESLDDTMWDNRMAQMNADELACKQVHRRRTIDLIKEIKTDIVIIISSWPATDQTLRMRQESVSIDFETNSTRSSPWTRKVSQLEETVAVLFDAGKKVIIVGVVPEATVDILLCYTSRGPLAFMKTCPSIIDLSENNPVTLRFLHTREALNLLMEESPLLKEAISSEKLVYIDPVQSLCDLKTRKCALTHESKLMYFDNRHMTQTGALFLTAPVQSALTFLNRRENSLAMTGNATVAINNVLQQA